METPTCEQQVQWGEQYRAAARAPEEQRRRELRAPTEEEAFVDPLIARSRPRRPDARAFALQHRVLLSWT